MLHRSTTLAVTALVSGLLLGTPGSAATAAAETCQGRPATIVGTGPDIQGTPGDDVVVTGASRVTYAQAGNDLICVSASVAEDVHVFAGPGDDVIDASTSTKTPLPWTVAHLDTGRDRFIGGPGDEEVYADGADDDMTGVDLAVLEVTDPVTGPPGSYAGSHIRALSADQDVEIDLDAQVVMVAGVKVADLAGFSRASAVAPRADVRGNAEDNFLRASGCDVHIAGMAATTSSTDIGARVRPGSSVGARSRCGAARATTTSRAGWVATG